MWGLCCSRQHHGERDPCTTSLPTSLLKKKTQSNQKKRKQTKLQKDTAKFSIFCPSRNLKNEARIQRQILVLVPGDLRVRAGFGEQPVRFISFSLGQRMAVSAPFICTSGTSNSAQLGRAFSHEPCFAFPWGAQQMALARE